MKRLPSLRVCIELLRLRRRLPSLVANLPLDRLLSELDTRRAKRFMQRDVLDRSVEVAEALVRRGRLAPDTCLFRALSRYALLHAHGVEPAFCLGVKPPPDSSAGHAWVEDDDGPYLEEIADDAYVITFAHPNGVNSKDRHELSTQQG